MFLLEWAVFGALGVFSYSTTMQFLAVLRADHRQHEAVFRLDVRHSADLQAALSIFDMAHQQKSLVRTTSHLCPAW